MTTLDVNNTISSVEQVGWMDPDLEKPAAFKHTLHLLDSFKIDQCIYSNMVPERPPPL